MTGTLVTKKTSQGKAYFYIVLSYKDPETGKWRQKTISTGLEEKGNKRKAKEMIPDVIAKYDFLKNMPSSKFVDPNVRICEYLDYWLAEKKRDIRSSTFEAYTIKVEKLKEYFKVSNPKLVDVTPKMIDTFCKVQMDCGGRDQKTGKRVPLSVRTVRDLKNILFSMFTQAQIDIGLKFNPVAGIHVHGKKNRAYESEFCFLTEAELEKLIRFIDVHYPKLLGIVFFGSYYGMRRSEILGLKWNAVDFENRKLYIRHTVVRVRSVIDSDDTKTTSSRRVLPLWDTAIDCLRKIQREQQANAAFFKGSYQNREGYVFTWEDGRTYDPNYITREFRKAMKEFGRPEVTLHKLRHSCASILISRNWDVKQVQYWLGHKDIETTLDIYAHYSREKLDGHEDEMEEITSCIDNLFTGEKDATKNTVSARKESKKESLEKIEKQEKEKPIEEKNSSKIISFQDFGRLKGAQTRTNSAT